MARTYHVLKYEGPGEAGPYYERLASLEASSGEQAIRLVAIENDSGRYVAIPESNWTEVGVRVEIPAPRVIFENETKPDVLDEALDELEAEGLIEVVDEPSQEETLIDDEQFQERKAELAARRTGQ